MNISTTNFSFKEPLSFGWETAKKKIWFFAALIVILLVLSGAGSWLGNFILVKVPDSIWPFDFALAAIYYLVYLYLTILLSVGVLKIFLKLADRQEPDWKDL